MPVGQTELIMAQIASHLEPDTIITDAGSTKQDVIISALKHLPPQNIINFVPGHPIAGTEQSGVTAAQANLYEGKHVVLTPLEQIQSSNTRNSLSIVASVRCKNFNHAC
jgi:prephenate dehydrogenase